MLNTKRFIINIKRALKEIIQLILGAIIQLSLIITNVSMIKMDVKGIIINIKIELS